MNSYLCTQSDEQKKSREICDVIGGNRAEKKTNI